MNTCGRRHRCKTYAWLRVGAVTLGMGAALASGSGLAHADGTGSDGSSSSGASTSSSNGSALSTPSAGAVGGTAKTDSSPGDATSKGEPGTAGLKTPKSTLSAQHNESATDSATTINSLAIPKDATQGGLLPKSAASLDVSPTDNTPAASASTLTPKATQAPASAPKLRTSKASPASSAAEPAVSAVEVPTAPLAARTSTTDGPSLVAAAVVQQPSAAAVFSPADFLSATTLSPTAAAAPVTGPVTVKSIVTDVLTWMGLGPLATNLPIPTVPLSAWIDTLWLAVRQNQYGLDNQRLAAAPTSSAPGFGAVADEAAPGTADLDELRSRPGVEVSLKPGGVIDVIDGTFTDTTVASATDAAQLLNGLAPLLGARVGFASPGNITVQRVGPTAATLGDITETFYRVHDSVDGIPALGSEVILVTDGNGKVTGLFNNHDSRIDSVDVTADPRIDDAAEANTVAAVAYLNSIAGQPDRWLVSALIAPPTYDPELVVYTPDASTPPRLTWRVVVDPSDTVQLLGLTPDPGTTYYIYANGPDAGTVMVAISNAQALAPDSATAYDLLRQSRQINVADTDFFGLFHTTSLDDLTRNISTYTTSYQFFGFGAPVVPGIIVQPGWFGWDPSAVSAHANLAATYDYYKDVLGLNSFDGRGAAIEDSIQYNPHATLTDYFTPYSNAFWDPTEQQFAFGNGSSLEAALDVVAHEYTHAVVSYIVGSGGSVLDHGESGALNEAYADIMGSLIEGKSGADRWLIGEDSDWAGGALRSMSNPSAYVTAFGPYRDNYDNRYTGADDNGGTHVNSTIFSHAAYLMMTDSATNDISDDTWATLFYRSLYRLSPSATFTDGRAAILDAAGDLGFAQAQHDAITRAFDSVGID